MDNDTAAGATTTEHPLVLRSFPVALFNAAEQEWAGLLREYALRGFGDATQPYGAQDVAEAAGALGAVAAALAAHTRKARSLPLPHRVDLEVAPGTATAGDFATLQAILEDARRLAADGQLLLLPTLPEVAALRNWISDEVTAQLAGALPQPWDFAATAGDPTREPLAEWDRAIAPPADMAWLVGDDHNRIVGASSAALSLLGWDEPDLLGQRLLVVVPHRLRELHVAAFTRSVVSGDDRLLGTPLPLPALTRDGREIPIVLTLTRHGAKHGRTVYLGRLEPRP